MNNNLLNVLLIFIAASCNTNRVVVNKKYDIVVMQANKLCDYVLKKDNENFVNMLYPEFIAKVGGKDKMIEMLNKSYIDLERQGIIINSVKVVKTNTILKIGEELQTSVFQELFFTVPKGILISKSTMIAVSKNNGNSWTFMDTAGKDLKSLQKDFPNLSNKLIIPPPKQPVLLPK